MARKPKSTNIPKLPPKSTKWHPLSFQDYDNYDDVKGYAINDDVVCCGVQEIYEISEGSFIEDIEIKSVNIDDRDYDAKYTRPATFKEYVKAVEEDMRKNIPGLAITFLLKDQQDGDFGKVLKAAGWEFHGKFKNRNTGNTLWHWSKVYNKAPRTKKCKSLFRKGN